jgi:hypothetical protein
MRGGGAGCDGRGDCSRLISIRYQGWCSRSGEPSRTSPARLAGPTLTLIAVFSNQVRYQSEELVDGFAKPREGSPMKRLVLISALASCSGCLTIQNRYSVLGIEAGEMDSLAEARVWSLALLIGVAVVSALLAVLLFWLGQRWLARRRMRAKELLLRGSPLPVARADDRDETIALGEATQPSTEVSIRK